MSFPFLPFCTGFILYIVQSQSFQLPSFLRKNRHLMLIKILAYKAALRFSILHLCWHFHLISKFFAKACKANIFLCVNMCTSWLITCSFKSFNLFHHKWKSKSKRLLVFPWPRLCLPWFDEFSWSYFVIIVTTFS